MTHSSQTPVPPVSASVPSVDGPDETSETLPPPPPAWSQGKAAIAAVTTATDSGQDRGSQRSTLTPEPVHSDAASPDPASLEPLSLKQSSLPERPGSLEHPSLLADQKTSLADETQNTQKTTSPQPISGYFQHNNQENWPKTANTNGIGQRWRNLSLRFKATVVVLALVLIPVAGLGAAATVFAGRSLELRIKDLEEDTTRASADKVAFFLKERYGDLQALSNADFLRNPVLLSGKLRTPDLEADKLDQFLQAYGVYDSIAVYDRQGNFRIQSRSQGTPRENIRSQAEQPYFQQVLETGEPYISQPFIPEDVDLAKYSIFLAAPIRANGQIVGIVRARMPVRYMSEVLASQQEGGSGSGLTFYLVDDGGIVFASSSSEESVTNSTTELKAEAIVPIFRDLQETDEIQTLSLGKDSIISYVPLSRVGRAFQGELPDLGWSTMATIAQVEALAPLRNLRLTLLVGTAFAMVGIGVLVVGVVNRLVRPLTAAARAVTRIGQGDLKARVGVQGEDEIAHLGRNINNMASQIEQLLRSQSKVAEEAQFLAEIVSLSVSSAQDLDQLFGQALDGAKRLLGVDQLALYQMAPGDPVLLAEASSGYALANQPMPPCADAHRDRYRSGEVWVMTDLLTATLEADHYQWLSRLQVKAGLEIALATGDDRLIVLMVQDCRSSRNWQPSQLNFVRELAKRLATAMSRVSFLEQINTARQQAEILAIEQTNLKEGLQRRALELLMEVDPVSQGDLTIRARVTEDEIGTVADSYNATIESLRSIVQQVQSAAELVAVTARTSESAVGNLSTGASTQTEELAVALQQIEDMARSIQEVTTNAQAAEVAVQQASQTVQEGDDAMNRTVDGILAIRETVGETAKKVKRLGESSQRISKVVNLISSFAAQTNLLALNASIEAARAGEEGRGFAVVADEVRSLARQSAEATAEIEKLVAGIQAETQEVVAAMEAGTEQVVTGTQLVDATRQSLTRIANTSQDISRLVNSIATAAAQQSTASSSVTQSMTGLATIAQHTSTEAEQVAQSFQQLLTVAQTLQSEVARFKVS